MSIKITCYGSRGSIPSPSTFNFDTRKYGGNTSSYFVEAGPFKIILDFGSGSRKLGNDLFSSGMGINNDFIACISHFHWDHIQGAPFCGPLYVNSNHFHFHGFAPDANSENLSLAIKNVLSDQQQSPHFPVSHSAMPCKKSYHGHQRQFSEVIRYFADDNNRYVYMSNHEYDSFYKDTINKKNDYRWLKITTIPLNHPDGCLGYKIDYMGKSIAYCTDNEPLLYTNAQINKICKNVDWILLDAQYTISQLSQKCQSFGHGEAGACVEQANAVNAKTCVLHHHDPESDDDAVDNIETFAKQYSKDISYKGDVECAKEGQVWVIE